LHVEGDVAALAGVHLDALDAALCPEHQSGAVGDPGETRVEALHAPGFLHVAVETGVEQPLLAGTEILQEQCRVEGGFAAPAADESQVATVRRRGGAHGPAGAGDHGLDLAVLEGEPADLEYLLVAVLGIFE